MLWIREAQIVDSSVTLSQAQGKASTLEAEDAATAERLKKPCQGSNLRLHQQKRDHKTKLDVKDKKYQNLKAYLAEKKKTLQEQIEQFEAVLEEIEKARNMDKLLKGSIASTEFKLGQALIDLG